MAEVNADDCSLGGLPFGPPTGGAISLTGLENLSSSEKSARIAAVVSDIYASIIFISRHVKAGTLTKHHCKPLYNFMDNIITTERKQKRKVVRELRRQDGRMERMASRHQRDVEKLLGLARSAIMHLRRSMERLQMELDELKGKRRIDLGDIEKRLPVKMADETGPVGTDELKNGAEEVACPGDKQVEDECRVRSPLNPDVSETA
ncbi:predicted protein [Uncinocarpus reesii 1704]|uniref:Uncharacterized protein n=1 Tax=Uncinocarpus reesii (strain UAMH 1704) TaxID=336963 RepID=C4JNL5_UNCRE|nr:uncharacterized protein UREG_03013 [Uncinocarpus reesii 1704]EEP78168.1 predicted protein [Uncinocarpus reesii 1704]